MMKRPLMQLSTYCIFCILGIVLLSGCKNESSPIASQKKVTDTLLVDEKTEDLLVSDSDYQVDYLAELNRDRHSYSECYVVDTLPEFPGGKKAMESFIQKHLKYPHTLSDISGVGYVTFWVQQDGHLEDIHVLKGIGPDFDKEALRVIQLMPNWKPAQFNHRNVSCRYTLPISFSTLTK
ncbi:energy transducer TonB [Cytophagaceae bacterium DM2B3-1]|uniref:Energy transducer TonB n=1 Tax=Xanthocytophaga flava TaxID=3048013 RepID=A0ABT7CN83_9BACT|nr:energy transducer TonB [Xanthocytophaga flavus]MDJ1469942.1 energy transducer TonB [Xanthocytophaga flavus]MDJ1494452.1 energy transducer TonB [Xanthocytophaga flavus]